MKGFTPLSQPVSCSSPPHLMGMEVRSLGYEDLGCGEHLCGGNVYVGTYIMVVHGKLCSIQLDNKFVGVMVWVVGVVIGGSCYN